MNKNKRSNSKTKQNNATSIKKYARLIRSFVKRHLIVEINKRSVSVNIMFAHEYKPALHSYKLPHSDNVVQVVLYNA